MEDVKMVPCLKCTECIKIIRSMDKRKEAFLRERAALPRCRGCDKLADLKIIEAARKRSND